jgi:hypothetical protein
MNPFTMRSKRLNLITATLACFSFFGCKRTTEEFKSPLLSDYLPLQVGKYITYRLDSTVFTNFGTVTAVHSFQEKQIVDAQITDASGRDSYRILRFIRDTAGTQSWTQAGSYAITPTDKTVEVIENNLRFIKLVMPLTQDNSWKGNRYLPDEAFSPLYSFDNDQGMEDWDYSYTSVGGSLVVKGQTYNDVITVDADIFRAIINAVDENSTTFIDPSGYASVSYLQENYAKGVGLISQQFVMWEYQPPSSPTAGKQGFAVKRSIIDHN